MLMELSISNFAIIDKISVTFSEGLTVLTGETGAGKSIIIDAVGLIAGGRGSIEFVRHGAPKAEIEGLFSIDNKDHPIYQVGLANGIEILDGMVVLHRTITAGGKSICRVNGKLVTLTLLKEFGKTLIDIHSQHETQSLMDAENHINLLDLYDPQTIDLAKKKYTLLYSKYVSLNQKYKKLNDNEQKISHRLDLLEFQMRELVDASLQPLEDEKLEEERSQLMNYEKIYLGIQNAYNSLSGEQKAIDWLNNAQLSLQEISTYDHFIAKKSEELTNYFYMIEELSFELNDFRDTFHYDAERLNEIESRLHEIDRLKRKYGPTVSKMLEYMVEIEEEIDQIKNKDSHLTALKKQIDEIAEDAYLAAKHLHELRKNAAESLTTNIHKELKGLYLQNANFSVAFNPIMPEDLTDFTAEQVRLHKNGIDQLHFLISTNPGEPLKELNKIASGGELSRIMLAIKKIFAKDQSVTSIIFDEVDTGVSGRVAQAMAEKIYEVSRDSQVLCITHLPQVAAMADTHKYIQKMDRKGRIATGVTELSREETIEELSRMITGTELTETALEHGRKLLHLASKFKEKNT